jgi:RimJ/RimL family protein N-acetyltransferase
MIGAKDRWGQGLGRDVVSHVTKWGFDNLNLNRISLSVLATNDRAIRLYTLLGFVEEGRCRQAQFKDDGYVDVVLMSLLRAERKT